MRGQSTNTLLLVRPFRFRMNEQTIVNNYYQKPLDIADASRQAVEEFDDLILKMSKLGIRTIVLQDTENPDTPDSIFPNNWISFHDNGTLVTYPMFAENRRAERRTDVLDFLSRNEIRISRHTDYSHFERQGLYLEGTGSLVLDRLQRIAYAALSPRTDLRVLRQWAEQMEYDYYAFQAFQTFAGERLPIYHTNVMMSIGTEWALFCPASVDDQKERAALRERLSREREIIEISESAVASFGGNILEVQNNNGKKFIVMSETAARALEGETLRRLSRYGEPVTFALNTIEQLGGGSVRCMLAEVFVDSQTS